MKSVATLLICLIIVINGDEGSRRLLQTDACAKETCPECHECVAKKNGGFKCKKIHQCCTNDGDCNRKRVCVNKKCVRKDTCKQCGGIQGLQCPSGERCVDDPSDTCDPLNGGRDCIGCCQQCPLIKCSDPCEPCGTMPDGTTCKTIPGTLDNGCPGCPILVACPAGSCKFCGGIAAFQCPDPSKQICVDDPTDNCDPAKGGRDCGGCCQIKVPGPCPMFPCIDPCKVCGIGEKCITQSYVNYNNGCQGCGELVECVKECVECGGIQGIRCPSGQQCIANPLQCPDGGADCGGCCIDCSATSCDVPVCEGGEELYVPDGECCPKCRATGCTANTGCKSCDLSGTDACNSVDIQITSCDPNTCPTVRIGCNAGYAPFNVGSCCGCYKL